MGAKTITETLLEMYYFSALRDHFCDLFGEDYLRILKPSPNREKWLGFDQGWVKAKKTGLPLERDLKGFIHSDKKPLDVFRAFFLQFKVVESRRTRRGAPDGWTAPWFAAPLSLEADKDTKISQHETLKRLSQLDNSEVSYACPMIFSLDEIIRPPDLTTLRTIDVRSAPDGWLTSGSHKIAFQTPTSDALWCSDPESAKDLDLAQALERLRPMSEDGLDEYLATVSKEIWGGFEPSSDRNRLPESLIVIGSAKQTKRRTRRG